MQDSSIYEPELIKAIFERVVPFTPPDKRPSWISKDSSIPTSAQATDRDYAGAQHPSVWSDPPKTRTEFWNLRVAALSRIFAVKTAPAQALFAAEVTTYVEQLREVIALADSDILEQIPILGPRFLPPTSACYRLRGRVPSKAEQQVCPVIMLVTDYSSGIAVMCPQGFEEDATEHHAMQHQSWQPPRQVLGLLTAEYVVGEQLRCQRCRKYVSKLQQGVDKLNRNNQTSLLDHLRDEDEMRHVFTVTTTSPAFRDYFKPFDFPMYFPYMTEQSGITREILYFAHAQQDHTNYTRFLADLSNLRLIYYWNRRREHVSAQSSLLAPFEAFFDYPTSSSTMDLDYKVLKSAVEAITTQEIKPACEQLCRMFGAVAMFVDWTRKFGLKAKIREARLYKETSSTPGASTSQTTAPIQPQKDSNMFHGAGIGSIMNEFQIILAFQFMTEESYKTLEPTILGLVDRFAKLGTDLKVFGCDNSKMITSNLVHHFKNAKSMEDVPHVLRRFQGCVDQRHVQEAYGPLCTQLANCFYISTAQNGKPAIYRTSDEQAKLLEEWYTRWKAAGAFRLNQPPSLDIDRVYASQMELVRSGACTHDYANLSTSQSPLEGSYKHLGDTRRGMTAGLRTLVHVLYFWVLKWNLKMAMKQKHLATDFLKSTYGCYALDLVDRVLKDEHSLHGRSLEVFPDIQSQEKFGISDYQVRSLLERDANALDEDELNNNPLPPIMEQDEEESENDQGDRNAIIRTEQPQDATALRRQLANRNLITLDFDNPPLVARSSLPAVQPKPFQIVYTNFSSAVKVKICITRRKNVRQPVIERTNPSSQLNYTRLSKSAQFAADNLKINTYVYSEELTKPDFASMIHLMLGRNWSSFDKLSQNDRDLRRQVFNQEQRIRSVAVSDLKNLHGFEASIRKVERQMCWKAVAGTLHDETARHPDFWLNLAKSSDKRRQICAVINPEKYKSLLNISETSQSTPSTTTVLPAKLPLRRERSRSGSLQSVLAPEAPAFASRTDSRGFPPQINPESQAPVASQSGDKRKSQRRPGKCRRCGSGEPGSHTRTGCVADGGPRPLSSSGNRSFNIPCPIWPAEIGLPYPLPKAIFVGKFAELSAQGFTDTYDRVREMIFHNRQRDFTIEESNFVVLLGGVLKLQQTTAADALSFTMNDYITWSQQRKAIEVQGRSNNTKSLKGKSGKGNRATRDATTDEGEGSQSITGSRKRASASGQTGSKKKKKKVNYVNRSISPDTE